MHSLAPITPLGGAAPLVETIGTVSITEVADRALASLACRLGQDAAFADRAAGLFGVALPGPGRWVEAGDWGLIWTGPGQWFVEAPFSTHEDIAARLKAAFGATASITEQSDAWAPFDLGGAGVLSLMERLAPVDTRAMATGAATRTIIEHMGCHVICREAGAVFTVMGARSFAGSLHHALKAAARSIA